jgi:sulfatase maturation enzyme AslB (radical SAM superfamily)
MKKLEQVELVEVSIEDSKATLTFLDAEAGEIREVNFNKKVYDKDTKKFVPDADKAAQVEEWSQQFFGTSFDDLPSAVGQRHDIYCYEKFNSMFESTVRDVAKFDADYVGQILNGEIVEVAVEDEGIRIYVEYEGDTYRCNMGFTKQVAGTYYQDPQKKIKQFAKFEEKFHVKPEEAGELVGKTVMFEVKKFAGNNSIYIDVKPFPKKKK